jgi:uncharacterized membrane protein YwzB
MIGTLIGIIFVLVVLGILWWGIQRVLPMLPIAEPFLTVINVLLVIIAAFIALWVIASLLGMAGIHVPLVGGLR